VPGHRPLNLDEPIPQGDLTEPPDWFTPAHVTVWQAALKAAPAGLLKELDRSVLVVWVTACVLHADAITKVSATGSVVRHPVTGAPIPNPYVQVAKQNAELMLRAASEMGFSPVSRSRVKVDVGKTVGNRFQELKDLPNLDE
jgi:P27 family predicted phage terminase small subunit